MMKNYENMSDFEVNRAVACRLDRNDLDVFGRPMFASDCYFSVPFGSSVEWHQFGCDESKLFDPCNNPSDAWPIIADVIANGCVVQILQAGVIVTLQGGGRIQFIDKNPLRAAMIVFLMMQESKS